MTFARKKCIIAFVYETAEKLNAHAGELADEGFFREAIACLQKAVTMEPQNSILWFNLGLTFHRAYSFAAAKQAFLKAADLDGDDFQIFDSLGLACYEAGEYDESRRHFLTGLDLNPFCETLWNNFGVLNFVQGKYEEAAEAFEQAVSIFPNYRDALFNLRGAYEKLGNAAGVQACDAQIAQMKSDEEK